MAAKLLYGKLDARFPVGLRHLVHYLTDPLPPGPDSVAPPPGPGVTDDPDASFPWGLLGNGDAGNCTVAAVPHLREANQEQTGDPVEAWPGPDEARTTYFGLTGGADSGLDEANVLQVWNTTGLFGNRCVGYAPLHQHYLAEIRSAIAMFGGVYLGADMPAPAQAQFDAGQPWALTHTGDDWTIDGGHAFPAVGYDLHHLYVVTWGRVQAVTWQWWEVYGSEAWAVLTSEDAAAKAGVNLGRLQAALAAVNARTESLRRAG